MTFTPSRDIDRQILRLALPALGALLAPALFVVVDAIIVGTLGATELAALGVGANIVGTILALSIFLAYGTTASVGRLVGATKLNEAFRETQTSAFFAATLGVAAGLALWFLARPTANAFAPSNVADSAFIYLRISALSIPLLLVSMSLTGSLRGFQDTKATLYVSVAAVIVNTVTCAVAVLVLNWGIAGSAWSTVVAEIVAVLGYAWAINRHVKSSWVHWRPSAASLKTMLMSSLLLFWRTAMLRVTLLGVLFVAGFYGTATLAAYHASFAIYGVAVFSLDALAIAAQALIAKSLGSGDKSLAARTARRVTWWSLGLGALLGLVLASTSNPLSRLFTSDASVQTLTATAILIVAALMLPASVAFAWDGVLIGASDFRFLALMQTFVLALFLPVLWWIWRFESSIEWLWFSIGWWLVLRCFALGLRLTSRSWRRPSVLSSTNVADN